MSATPSSLHVARLPVRRQLRWNLTLYFVGLAVLPLAIVTFIILSQVADQARRQVFDELKLAANLKTSQIRDWLGSAEQLMHVIIDTDSEGPLTNLIKAPNEADRAVINKNLSSSIAKLTKDTSSRAQLFERFIVYDVQGTVLAASDSGDVGKVVSRQPYFENSLVNSYTQSPFYAITTGKLTMIHSEPIVDNGKIIGAIAGQLNIDTLGSIMTERTGLGETGETYLVSDENNYFLTPSRFSGYTMTRAYHSEGIDAALRQKTGSGDYPDYRGIPVFGYYTWIPELRAGLLSEQDVREALSAAQDVLGASLAVAILSAVVALFMGVVRITQISAPIQRLTQAAAEISKGNLSLHVDIKSRNEIGLLADSFNQMTGQLANNIDELGHRVEEVREANKELQIASAKAREAARVKSEFMATMSHELRTPLNAMLGFSSIMLEGMGGQIDAEAEHMVARIHSNAERLLTLINSILDIAKIEAGRFEIMQKSVDMPQLIGAWRDQMSVLAEQKALKFQVQIDPALPKQVKTDPERLSQIVINLLSNAFKFTEKGGVTLSVKPIKDQMQIEVADTGIGIPPHALNFIFEEFRQLDGSSRRSYGGTGLGLAIVKNLCRMMDGNVRVQSDLGKGSSFTVTLPLHPVYEAAAV